MNATHLPGHAVTALKIEDLRKAFLTIDNRVVQAIAEIGIQIKRGERLAVLGPSGCGKSSLLRILAGLDNEYAGTIAWSEETIHDRTRLRSATVFQGDSTLPWMSIADNILIGLSGLEVPSGDAEARRLEYQGLVGLADFDKAFPHELSGGMRQRVAIARALATEPLLLLMDEPLAALDAQTRLVMQSELYRIWAATQSTVVYVTHDIDEALSLADRLLIMTARPGRVKAVIDVPFGRDVSPLQRRQLPEFGTLQAQVWAMVADEVGQSLQAGGKP
ncbi:MAG: ABC transporter ATP-binding protein [Alphaproteobacteria bacterium]|nr:MAG: ABC transporter ATP-binding protein [Alphaproteobacteria bacterium]